MVDRGCSSRFPGQPPGKKGSSAGAETRELAGVEDRGATGDSAEVFGAIESWAGGVGLESVTGAGEEEGRVVGSGKGLFSVGSAAGVDWEILEKVTLPAGVPSSFSRRLESVRVILRDDFGGMVTCESPRLKMLGLLAAGGRLTRMVFFPAELKP